VFAAHPSSHPHCSLLVWHMQEEAFDLADKVVIFNRGVVEQQGTPADIIKRPRTPFIMKFVGETNSVPANCILMRRSKCVFASLLLSSAA
jgi:sulfate/thiosulfate transport system ATP-binding protein